MNESNLQQAMKAYALGWKETGAYLEAERRERLRGVDTAAALGRLGSLFDSAVHLHRPAPSSGLVAFYECLKKSDPRS